MAIQVMARCGSSWSWRTSADTSRTPTCLFFRTADGAEIDFIVSQSGRTVAVECKVSSAPAVGKGTHIALDDIAPDAAFVITPVPESYQLDRRITVVNPGHIGRLFDH